MSVKCTQKLDITSLHYKDKQYDYEKYNGSWLGTLCCVLWQDTLLLRSLSTHRCINGYRQNPGGNPAMNWPPIQGGSKSLSHFMPHQLGEAPALVGHLSRKQTLLLALFA